MSTPEYRLITTAEHLRAACEELSRADAVGFDSETTALDPYDGRMRLVQFAAPSAPPVLIDLDRFTGDGDAATAESLAPLRALLAAARPVKVAHNAKFDAKWVKRTFGVELGGVFDTMLASQLVSAGETEDRHGLAVVAGRYLGEEVDKTQQLSNWGGELSAAQLEYAARDAALMLPLRDALISRLKSDALVKVAQIEFECVLPVASMELAGIYLDAARWREQIEIVKSKRAVLAAELQGMLSEGVSQGSLFENARADINLDSHTQLTAALKRLGVPVPDSTRNWKLQPLAADYKVVEVLLDYRTVQKSLTSYGENILDEINPKTGRIHANFHQIGAPTGRFACLAGDTIVPTSAGFKRMRDIGEGDAVKTSFGFRKVLRSWMTGVRQLYRVRLADGRSIRATADHRFLTGRADVWKQLAELNPGDALFVSLKGAESGQAQETTRIEVPAPEVRSRKPVRLLTFGALPSLQPVVEYLDLEARPVEIESITPDEVEEVYDITVEGVHEFIANGIVVHNCTNPNVQQVPHAEEYRRCFRAQGENRKLIIADYCVAEGTRVATRRGLLPVEEVRVGDEVFVEDGGTAEVSSVIARGRLPISTLTLRNGYSLRATSFHRIRVLDASGSYVWRRIRDLAPGDCVAVQPGRGLHGDLPYVELPPPVSTHFNNNKELTTPRFAEEGLAEFMGYLAGDGTFGKNHVGWVVNLQDADAASGLKRRAAELFGIEVHDRGSYRGVAEFGLYSVPLVRWQKGTGPGKKFNCWSVSILASGLQRFSELIGFMSARKRGKLDGLLKRWTGKTVVGNMPNLQQKVRSLRLSGEARRLLNNTSSLGRPVTASLASVIEADYPEIAHRLGLSRLTLYGQMFLPVVSVVPSGEQPVYDLSVPGPMTYISDGFVSHNSQIELRILAHVTEDKGFIEAFNSGADLHRVTAAQVFNVPVAGVTREQRDFAKRLNFGVVYGIGAQRFSMMTGLPLSDAEQIMSRYFQTYRGLDSWLRDAARRAVREKQARTMSGRLARFNFDPEDRQAASLVQRNGKNMPIQGCVSGETRVFERTAGYVPVERLEGREVCVWDGARFARARVAYSGRKRLVKVELWGGHHIECSPEHKFLTTDVNGRTKWRTPGEFVKGNYVAVTEPPGEWSVGCRFPALRIGASHNASRASLADAADEPFGLGVWLGRLASDGTLRERQLNLLVAEHEEIILPRLRALSERFGHVSYRTQRGGRGTKLLHSLTVSALGLARQLNDAGLKSRVPDFAWQDSRVLAGYLRGMFDGDGTVTPDGPALCFGQGGKHLAWAREIQQALLLFGVESRLNLCADRINVCVRKRDARLFAEKIGFVNPRKQEKVEGIRALKQVSKIYGRAVRIKSVEFTDEWIDMYDVVDSETGRFMANGLITHNSSADILKRALRLLHDRLRGTTAEIVNIVHDEVVVEADADQSQEIAKVVEESMCAAGEEFVTRVPVKVETEIGDEWVK
ncbi:MAG: Hint domain-containing protein [Acidobacteria bacterium]|nr:Hint domain-containing protein [Acidobacteriota bacterium]